MQGTRLDLGVHFLVQVVNDDSFALYDIPDPRYFGEHLLSRLAKDKRKYFTVAIKANAFNDFPPLTTIIACSPCAAREAGPNRLPLECKIHERSSLMFTDAERYLAEICASSFLSEKEGTHCRAGNCHRTEVWKLPRWRLSERAWAQAFSVHHEMFAFVHDGRMRNRGLTFVTRCTVHTFALYIFNGTDMLLSSHNLFNQFNRLL